MMKKRLGMIAALSVLCSVLTAGVERIDVFAAEATGQVTVVEYRGAESNVPEEDSQEADVLFNRKEARGETAPIHYWDLSERPYKYILKNVTEYTITNRYFKPDANGCISISTIGLDAGGNEITIELKKTGGFFYDKVVASWTGNPQSIQGLGFNNLDPEAYYYFYFSVERGKGICVNGEGLIHHPE